jgi:hypothetical protein
MLMALLFSDAALNASKLDGNQVRHDKRSSEPHVTTTPRARSWTPGVRNWTIEKSECPAFFRREIEGFGVVRVGPRCADEEVPYAL